MAKIIDTGLTTLGVRSNFFESMKAVERKYPLFATEVPSTTETESYKWLGAVNFPRRWLGPRQPGGVRSESYNITNWVYENTLDISVDELADDQTGQIMIRAREMGQTTGRGRDEVFFGVLSAGLTTSGYDGVPFFNSAHSWGDSGSQSNIISCTAATGTTPTVAEAQAYFGSAYGKMAGFKDDKGHYTLTDMSGLVLLCNPRHKWIWQQAFNPNQFSTAENIYGNVARVIDDPRVTSTSWYLLTTAPILKSFVFQLRQDTLFTAMDQEISPGVYYNNTISYGTKERWRFAYGHWQYGVLGRWF